MDHIEVGKYWDGNAETWTKLARMGFDVYRDHVNSPAFFEMLGEVDGLKGIDIGCGEGHNTRTTAGLGAKMSAIDISQIFINHAKQAEAEKPLGIEYQLASAIDLPFDDGQFDFAMATMSLMDIPETEKVLKEAWRVLKPGGFLQFSISHPCFFTPRWQWINDKDDKRDALLCGDYFNQPQGRVDQWIFSYLPDELKDNVQKFKVPNFFMTLSNWLNLLMDTGFTLERFAEPTADAKALEKYPQLADTPKIAYFLIIRCRK